jgi:cytochrome P450
MSLVPITLLLLTVYALTWPYKLYRNYLIARKTGLRLIISPITPFELPWHILPAIFNSWVKRQRWFRALDQTCAWQDKNALHEELGLCFMHVSPGMNMLCTSDAVAIDHVFKNMNTFVKPEVFKTLDFFGPNLVTVNGESWVQHRKLTAPCFNERVSSFVWDESLRQANAMLEAWLAKPHAKSNNVVNELGTVTLHVITAATFGEQHDFHSGLNILPPNHSLTFRSSLKLVLRNPVTAAVVRGMPWLKNTFIQPLLSHRIQQVQLALTEFNTYMLEAISRERTSSISNTRGEKKTNLLTTLLAATTTSSVNPADSKGKPGLSDTAITGNLFTFAFAGHETTASTLSYTLALLALHPDIQEWVTEELDAVILSSSSSSVGAMEYAKIHPKLPRTLALMYETVRMFGVPPPWRDVACRDAQLLVSSSASVSNEGKGAEVEYIPVPPNTQILSNVFACHSSPANFPDADTWDPKRWIRASADGGGGERFEGRCKKFFGWGGGARVCPGMSKFHHHHHHHLLDQILCT